MPEEWRRPHHHYPGAPPAGAPYPPLANPPGINGRFKDGHVPVGPMSSDDAAAATGNMVPQQQNQNQNLPSRTQQAEGSLESSKKRPVKPAELDEGLDRPESPKEILDLDSHRLASSKRAPAPAPAPAPYPQTSHPPQHHHHPGNFMYDTQKALGRMPQGAGPYPPHMMGRGPFPPHHPQNNYPPREGPYSAQQQQPNRYLLEAFHRPQQQLPFGLSQSHVSMPPRPGQPPHQSALHFQGPVPTQRGLPPPEHYFGPR